MCHKLSQVKPASNGQSPINTTNTIGESAGVPDRPVPLPLPNPEVIVKASRRSFTAEYKLKILQAIDACQKPGEIGAILRREGLYSSHLTKWRRERKQGELQGLVPAKRGRKADLQAAEITRLQREADRLQARLERAEVIIDVQKKLSQLLGLPPVEIDENK